MKLTLTIEMGFAAVQDGEDLAGMLEHEAARLRDGFTSGYIRDANGNTAGYWEIS